MRILFVIPDSDDVQGIHEQAMAAFNVVQASVKDILGRKETELEQCNVDTLVKSTCGTSDVIAGVAYGDVTAKKVAGLTTLRQIPIFALTGTGWNYSKNIFPLLPSPETSGFLLARGLVNIIRHTNDNNRKWKVLFVCMHVSDEDDDGRKASFEATIRAHCKCDCDSCKYSIDKEKDENKEINDIIDTMASKDPELIAVFGYGSGFQRLVARLSNKWPDAKVLCDFNYSGDSANPGENKNVSWLDLKSGSGELITGEKVFSLLAGEVLKAIANGIDETVDAATSRSRLMKWIPDIKYFRSCAGNFLFRGDNVLCYPIWQYDNQYGNHIIDRGHGEEEESPAEIVSDQLNRAGRIVEDWKSGKIKTLVELFKRVETILGTSPFSVQKFVFGCSSPMPYEKDTIIYYASSDVRKNTNYWRSQDDLEKKFAFLFASWFGDLCVGGSRNENGSMEDSDIPPLQINLDGEDLVDNDTCRLYCVVESDEGQAKVQIVPIWSALRGVSNCHSKKICRIRLGKSDSGKIKEIPIVGSNAKTRLKDIDSFYSRFEEVATKGVAYCLAYGSGSVVDFLGRCVIWRDEKFRAYELKILSNIMGMVFSAVADKRAQQRILESSLKAAIGSIMSRNGSHNIGSHVLAALSHNVGTMPDDRVLYQYIQHRMDYIATAVGELPSWTYSTKFVGGVIREFLSQRHLLEYISKSEGLQAFKFQDPNHIGNNRFNQKNTIRLHVRRSDYGLPKGVNEVDFIEYSETNDDVQQRLQYDIDVALPGGVVGGHAFFTILENVIRNAAKHGWATKRDTERKDENLDIYVDFKRDEDCQNATVVVYDGISDVFSVLDEEKSNDVGERNGIRKLKDWIEANRETLCSSLDKKSLEQLKAYIEDKGENLPIPYGGLVNVLSESVDCGGDNNGKKKKVWEVIKGNLAGKTDSDKELGHRLWLPLHHSHQIKLATPFIDDAGSLRRENWGLAEMKISAGYLQMRTISEIGGLDSDVNGYDGFKKIITPVCVKHVSFSKDGKKETHHHLGYEFKIRCPRELLFVVQGEKPSGDAAKAAEQILLRHGVHIRYIEDSGYDAVFALQNNPSRLEWDFRYVMLPAFPQVPNPKLPFRVLTGKRSCKWCVPHFQEYSTFRKRLESVLAGAEGAETWVHDLKKAVYKTWLAYWQSDRRKDIGKPVLSLVVDPGGGSGDGAGKRGGECLISDSDLWSVVLDNLFRTLVRQHLSLSFGHELEYRMKCHLVRIAVSDTREMLSDFDVSRPRYSLGRQIAAWFEKSNLENTPKDETLKSLAKDFMADGDAVPRQERDKILEKIVDGDYAAEIQQFHSSLKEWLRKCKNAKSSSEHDFEAPQVDVNGKSYNYPGFQKFMDSCLVAFEHSAVFLRKYEERIATLPESFQVKASGGDGTSFVNATAQIGIDAVTGGSIPESRKAIRYERHFDAGAFDRNTMAYAEPLSGTQTYLNMLGQLVGNNDCPIETVYSVSVSLMENALTRILIIDERTADFLKKHELSKQTYAHMGVWVLDDKTVEGCTPPQKSPDNKEWNPNVEQALLPASDIGVRIFTGMANCDDGDGEERRRWRKFDIVVIHQGLIDKWLSASAHDAKGVESLLERLKERVPYVVITTGRGTPSNTPATARILPFSVIEKTMFRQSPEKMILVDTVMNILPVGERKQ